MRHSTPEKYWCYVYERLVKYYKRQTTNMKNVAKTFITRGVYEFAGVERWSGLLDWSTGVPRPLVYP